MGASPEWVLHALLTPTKEAQDLDVSVLHGATSACLTLRWTRSGVVGDLYASADDVPLLDAIAARGWEARVPPKGIAGKIALLAHRPVKTHLKPLIALSDPNQAVEKAAAPVAHATEPSGSVAPAASLADELLTRDGTGLLIGMGENGKPVGLHFRPQRLAVVAGPQRELALALLIARAFGLGAGVVAIVPSSVAALLRQSGYKERLRFLDGSDPYQSASIPWRSLDPLTLDAALASTGIASHNGHGHQAASFVDLLPSYLANDETRLLTAPPGDDLRGVVAAGGGVVLVEDLNNPHLAALLLHLMIGDLGRPLVVIRPDYVVIPETLQETAFDIVLGDAPSHTVLREQPDGWVVSDPDLRWSEYVQRDLQAVSFSSNDDLQSALVAGLEGHEQHQVAPVLAPVPTEPEAPLWDIPAFELEPAHAGEAAFEREPEEVAHVDEPTASDETLTWGDLAKQIDQEPETDETIQDDDRALDDLSDQLEHAPAWLKQAIEEADTREEPSTDNFALTDEADLHEDGELLTRVGADIELIDPPTSGSVMPDEAEYGADPFDDLITTDESIRVGADMEPLDPPTSGVVLTEEPEELDAQIEPLFVGKIGSTDTDVGADSERGPELLPFEADQWAIDLGQDGEEPEETEASIQPRRAVSRARVLGRRRVGLKPRFTSQHSAPVDETMSQEPDPPTFGTGSPFVGADTDTEIPFVAPLVELVAPEIEQPLVELEEPETEQVAPVAEQTDPELELPLTPLAELVAPVIEQPLVADPKPPHVEMSIPTTNRVTNGVVGGSTAHLNGQAAQPVARTATSDEIDLAPVAELIRLAREQGQSLPSLIAQIAPHYPQIAPAALRRAVRTMLDPPSAVPAPMVATPIKLAPFVVKQDPTTNGIAMVHVGATEEPEEAASDDETPPSEEVFFDGANLPIEDEDDPPTNGIGALHVGVTEDEEESTSEEGEEQPAASSMSTTEAARFLKVAPRTVQRWADDGKLASFRDDENNRRFYEHELKRFKDEREAGR